MQSSSWRVLHVLSNHEKRVAQHLVVRSVEYYLPLFTERVKWTDRTVVSERPLFSGYVFARFSPQSRISVISTPGVLHLLGDEERDMVRDEELTKIRNGLASGLSLRPHSGISVGTRVRVRNGVFEGVEGVVTELRKQCRVIITLAPVRQCFSLETEIDDLVVLDKLAAKPGLNVVPAYGY
ncbi:MAG TPA: transcription termination/antitermination NusG family protein [Terracidiphilus sp.]|nr:transcription termination/antitermination NusG family protein [Terracidiphilus sp.]